jgi:cyanophycinase
VSGPAFAIGGHEDREGERAILRAVAAALPHPVLVVATVASKRFPEDLFETYRDAFTPMGVQVRHLSADHDTDDTAVLDGVGGVFFTGGDQLRIVEVLGGTVLGEAIVRAWRDGAVIAGTSAGASVLAATMIGRGRGEESPTDGSVELEAGLGILPSLVIDQHFAERGRIGRLVAAVAAAPQSLGVGIDEDTAIDVRGDVLEVLGAGGVTVIDGTDLRAVGDGEGGRVLSVTDVRAHLLAAGDRFDIAERRPIVRER